MTMIVGYAPDERGRSAVHLASMLARAAGDDLVVCAVVPAPWAPGMARVDTEYQSYLDEVADRALEQARTQVPHDIPAVYVRQRARSAPVGLLEAAKEYAANLVVLGSSSAGAFGHIVLGSVSDRLLHSSPVSVALAPRGFRGREDVRVARVTAAYDGSEHSDTLVVAAADIAARLDASLRIASFAVWSPVAYPTRLGTESENLVLREWTATIGERTRGVLKQVGSLPSLPRDIETVTGRGEAWATAIDDIDWYDGDLLVVGSSGLGPFAQVFLGSRATKILRHSPVPVVLVPRGRAEELADRSDGAG
jgi:nucleotide-binding universal stress UspA family protein